ncbi:hypothetical protein AYI70_g345 [Smittium culicis]|uniref:Uncharacterized protein n=1 Tax=Smittium culicis TaxID=133412 RepID=A0A1R1YH66_9FUNG|nr:hypothetical protein AYI70_g345 [Smittium culicis]
MIPGFLFSPLGVSSNSDDPMKNYAPYSNFSFEDPIKRRLSKESVAIIPCDLDQRITGGSTLVNISGDILIPNKVP